MFIHTKLQNKEIVIEPYLEPPDIHVSKKWASPSLILGEFENVVAEKWCIPDGWGRQIDFHLWFPGQILGPELVRASTVLSCISPNYVQ